MNFKPNLKQRLSKHHKDVYNDPLENVCNYPVETINMSMYHEVISKHVHMPKKVAEHLMKSGSGFLLMIIAFAIY